MVEELTFTEEVRRAEQEETEREEQERLWHRARKYVQLREPAPCRVLCARPSSHRPIVVCAKPTERTQCPPPFARTPEAASFSANVWQPYQPPLAPRVAPSAYAAEQKQTRPAPSVQLGKLSKARFEADIGVRTRPPSARTRRQTRGFTPRRSALVSFDSSLVYECLFIEQTVSAH